MTARAHGIGSMNLEHLPHRPRLAVLAALFERRNIWRRRRWRRREDGFEKVLPADGRRRAGRIGRHRQHGRFPEESEPILVGERDAPEMAAVDTRNAVVARELLVEECLI